MSFAQLTHNGDGTYGLPVVRTFNRPRPYTDAQGVQHAAQVMRLWAPGQLATIGLARLEESPIASEDVSTGFTDTLSGGVVQRQHTVEPRPVIEVVYDPIQYRSARKRAIADTLGAGSWEEAVGDQMDLIWQELEKLQTAGTAALSSQANAALASIAAIKAQFPKP